MTDTQTDGQTHTDRQSTNILFVVSIMVHGRQYHGIHSYKDMSIVLNLPKFIDASRPHRNGQNFANDIFTLIFLCENRCCLNKIWLKICSQWASCQIRKTVGCACAGNAWNVFPCRRLRRKPLVSGPGMHHGTCVTHVPWCMSGSLTHGGGENVPGIPDACAPTILPIWLEAHGPVANKQITPPPWVQHHI